MPEISIIVPVYNVEKYLSECLDSILAQTFTDFELILVNDGSRDNSASICREYANADRRIKLIEQDNAGLSSARNAGIDASIGPFLCFIDSDDLVSKDYCLTLYNAVKDSNCDFGVCGVTRFSDGSAPDPAIFSNGVRFLDSAKLLSLQLSGKSAFGVWNKLYRRSAIQGMRFREGMLNEDVFWSADLAVQCKKCAVVDQECYFYRQRSGSIMSAQAKQCPTDRIDAGEHLLKVCQAHFPSLFPESLRYAIEYPWMFLDPIYVHRSFSSNHAYLNRLREFLQKWIFEYEKFDVFPKIILHRMKLYAASPVLYGFNAYTRLARVYLYRLFQLDAYQDGHGI